MTRLNTFKTNSKNKPDGSYIKKYAIKFDITMMNALIGYVFKRSPQITRKSLNNLKDLFNIIDERPYETNDKLYARFKFIKKAIEARVDLGMETEGIMLNYCASDNNDLENQEIINNIKSYKKLNYEEISYINRNVQDRLRYAFIAAIREPMYDILERLELGKYNSYQEINEEMVQLCKKLIEKSRSVNVVDQTDTFSLDPKTFTDNVIHIANKLRDPGRILRTGIQKWNEILVRGYRSKRVYYYLGLPGGYKSMILLKSALDIRKYNKGIPSKKEGHRKTILIVTMENEVDETVERMFNMVVTADDIRDFDPKDVVKMMKENGEFLLQGKDDIDIVIKYYPNRSISTDDLYTIMDDLEDENREIISLILDYIKRIRPAEYGKDEKEELKNISNELKTLAISRDIPVITAHQLNRGAATVVDAALQSDKEDIARQIGRSNIGTAWEILENADWACIINIEQKRDTGQYYLTFKRVKIRYKTNTDLTYFNHPFLSENRVKLIDDVGYPESLSEISLSSDFDGAELVTRKGKRTAVEREIISEDSPEASQIFDFRLSKLKHQILPESKVS